MIPDPEYLPTADSSKPDSPTAASSDIITVIYEQSYDQWKSESNSDKSIQTGLMTADFATSDDKKDGGGERSAYSIMIHSVPKSLTGYELDNFVGDLSRSAEYLYITTNNEDYYESFAPDWMDFVDSVPTAAGKS